MNNFQYLQETRQSIKVTIDRTCKGGWICSYKSEELFLPGNQLYKEVNGFENCVGKTVTVLVQRADQNGALLFPIKIM
jgi:ribosomal protein S1